MRAQVASSSTGEPLRAKMAGNARQFLSFKFIDWRDVYVDQLMTGSPFQMGGN